MAGDRIDKAGTLIDRRQQPQTSGRSLGPQALPATMHHNAVRTYQVAPRPAMELRASTQVLPAWVA